MMKRNIDLGLLTLRIAVGGLMLFHGISKLFHGISFLTQDMGIFGYAVYIGEVFAPLAILIGWRTRIASFFYAINCIVAIGYAHLAELFRLSEHGGYANELLMLYLLGAITLGFTGAGRYAISTKNNWD